MFASHPPSDCLGETDDGKTIREGQDGPYCSTLISSSVKHLIVTTEQRYSRRICSSRPLVIQPVHRARPRNGRVIAAHTMDGMNDLGTAPGNVL